MSCGCLPGRLSRNILMFLLPILTFVPAYGKDTGFFVIEKKTEIRVKRKTLTTRTTLLLQINSRKGEEAAEFDLPWSPGVKISDLAARIEDTAGRIIRKLGKDQVSDHSLLTQESFYSDYMVKHFGMKYHLYPYRILLEYTTESDRFLLIGDWSPVHDRDAPTMNATLSLEIPAEYIVHILRRNVAPPVTDTVDGMARYRWVSEYRTPVPEETWDPPFDDQRPGVVIVPDRFEYGIEGSMQSWGTFGNYITTLLAGLDPLPPDEVIRVSSMTAGITDTLAKIRTLYRYLQDNTRYVSVSIDIGGIKPYPALFVARNKYGDCKALSLYMKALLQAAGIQSFYTVVEGAVTPSYIDPAFPSAHWFNHVILCIPYRSDTLWLDCTSRHLPAGYTAGFVQGRPAFVVDGSRSRLALIPSMTKEDVATTHVYRYSNPAAGSRRIKYTCQAKGPEYERMLDYAVSDDREKQKEFAREIVPSGFYELAGFHFNRASPDDPRITFAASLAATRETDTNVGKVAVSIPSVRLPSPEKVTARRNPVSLPCPVWFLDTICVPVPPGWKATAPPPKELTCDAGYYRTSSFLAHDSLVFCREVRMNRGNYSLARYPALFQWIGAVRANERQNTIIISKTDE